MAKNRKKVVLLIVEGESDEMLLIDRLRELFKGYDIRFEPQHGDILYNIEQQGKSIKDVIGETIKGVLLKRKFKPSDILAVIHIIDTDGCLITEENVVIDNLQQVLTFYKEDCISVLTDTQRYNILTRNEVRSRNIRTMNSVQRIVSKKYNYQMYYFSRNLEHVILDDPNPSSETKVENIESFLDDLASPIEEYLKHFMPELTKENYTEKYIETWSDVSTGKKSLLRSTNVPLMFEFIMLKTS